MLVLQSLKLNIKVVFPLPLSPEIPIVLFLIISISMFSKIFLEVPEYVKFTFFKKIPLEKN